MNKRPQEEDRIGLRLQPRTAFLRENLLLILLWPFIALLLGGILWWIILARLDQDKTAARSHAMQQASSLASSYAVQLLHTIEQVDQITLTLKYGWEDSNGTLDLQEQRDRGLYAEGSRLFASIIDRNGRMTTSTIGGRSGLNYSDLDYFQIHKAGFSKGLLISEPGIGRILNRMIVRFSQRLDAEDGSFDGVAVVVVEPDYLTTFHDDASLAAGDFISVRFEDGTLLAAKTHAQRNESYYRNHPVFEQVYGVVEEPKEKFSDGQSRFVAWKKLEKYPLVAIAGLSTKDAFAAYELNSRNYLGFASAGSAFLVIFALLGSFFSARLAWRTQHEEEVKATYRVATDAANEGFYMLRPLYDEDGHIEDFQFEDCNRRGAEMVGMPREQVIGHRASDLIPERYREEVLSVYRVAMDTGFYEDEIRVAPTASTHISWIYRRVVRSGIGLALTMRDITQAKAHEQALATLANTDALTSLPNRHWLIEFLPSAINQAMSSNTQLAVLFIDLDNFKNINDTLGHDAGDELLKAASRRLQSAVRTSDHVVRLGGDEFTVILQHVEAIEHVSRVARLLVETIGEPFVLGGASGNRVNASIGISLFPDDGKTGDILLKHADIAMYAAKEAGKGCYRFYQPYLSDALMLKLVQEGALRRAIDQNEFIIHYQPRVDIRSGKLRSVEALVRWAPPDRGLVYPLEFIHLAENSGMIAQLGELVAEQACAQLADWRRRGLPIVPVSVNVSARQLASEAFSEFMQECTARHDIDPALVEIELTESAMIDQDQVVLQEIARLRALGFKLSVDDFGTGYSSLAQLQRLHIDVLKVDPSFTKSLGRDHEPQALFKAVIAMAHALGMIVVAEGVETKEQLLALRALSCQEVQGSFICRPLPEQEIAPLIMKQFLLQEPWNPNPATAA
ncbi:MAG: bifunctional diguanylate cyclase/phosphodiesterase [Burkholderiaceae bacterium]